MLTLVASAGSGYSPVISAQGTTPHSVKQWSSVGTSARRSYTPGNSGNNAIKINLRTDKYIYTIKTDTLESLLSSRFGEEHPRIKSHRCCLRVSNGEAEVKCNMKLVLFVPIENYLRCA